MATTRPGDVVVYIDHSGARRRVKVFLSDENIAQGFAGFVGHEVDEDGFMTTGANWWGYDASIMEINGVPVS